MMNSRFTLQIVVATAIAVSLGLLLDHDALSAASSNLVAALSILNAAIFPTVILSATVLKPADYSSELIERYRVALRRQISFFFGMLLFSLTAIFAILIAQTLDWRLPIELPWPRLQQRLDGVFNFVIIAPVALVAMRIPAFFRALVSLVNVHVDAIAAEVERRERRDLELLQREISNLPSVSNHQRPPEPLPTS